MINTNIRGVHYCENQDCPNYHKSNFILNPSEQTYCPICNTRSLLQIENSQVLHRERNYYTEVRVEFDFKPADFKFHGLVAVKDTSQDPGAVYILQSPLIATPQRAERVANMTLANLCLNPEMELPNGMTRGTEIIIDFDVPRERFLSDLQDVSGRWQRADSWRQGNR